MKTKTRKAISKLMALLLALVMAMSLSVTAFAEGEGDNGDTSTKGSITIQNATIGETYTVYKLFDATYGDSYTDEDGNTVTPTTYVATEEQKTALEAMEGNVFVFTAIYDAKGEVSGYQVTIGTTTDDDGNTVSYTDEEVVAFVKGLIFSVNGFPGAVKVESIKATSDTVKFENLDFGYYFITSTLGAVVTIDTVNPDATVNDKNSSEPSPDNDPNPEEPVKDVVNSTTGESIDGTTVSTGDTLKYVIDFTNTGYYTEAEDGTLASVVIKDAPPEGTEYKSDSAAYKVTYVDSDGNKQEVTFTEGKYTDAENGIEITAKVEVDSDTGEITWTFTGVPKNYTVEAIFEVTVTDSAKNNDQNKIENTADVVVNNTFTIETNDVTNYVPDDSDPSKDVYKVTETTDDDGNTTESVGTDSYNTKQTEPGEVLQYEITYKNSGTNAQSVEITDAAPTGTVYVKGSAKLYIDGEEVENADISVDENGNITWKVESLAAESTVKATFQVTVTEEAYGITDQTVRNTADVSIDNNPAVKTNEVQNPLTPDEDYPYEPDPGKVIVSADGTETQVSTGAYGDTVTFDLGIDAVNKVTVTDENGNETIEQVTEYYIYDKMAPGFDFGDFEYLKINGTEYEISENSTTGTYEAKDSDGNVVATFGITTDTGGNTVIVGIVTWATYNNDGTKDDDGKDQGDGTWTSLYPNCEVHLRYTATINENAQIAGKGNVNAFKFSYNTTSGSGNNDTPTPESPTYPDGLDNGSDEKTTTTYTYALAIQKFSSETGEPLEGAEFTVTDNNGKAVYAVPATDENGEMIAGVYEYTSDSSAEGAVSVFETNGKGQIIIKGIDVGTYTFTETKAPSGYVLLTDSVDIEATMTSSSTTTVDTETTRYFEAITEEEWSAFTGTAYTKNSETDSFEIAELPETYTSDPTYYKVVSEETTSTESGSITYSFDVSSTILQVANTAGSLLPGTGGMGTTILYVIGIILVLGAGIILVVRRRMGASK